MIPDPASIRDAALQFIDDHEKTCTTTGIPGTPCWGERCNLIAFLYHSLGVQAHMIPDVLKRMREYDKHCECCTSHHGPINPN